MTSDHEHDRDGEHNRDGSPAPSGVDPEAHVDEGVSPPPATERQTERRQEDEEFLPVILKRTDEAVRHPDDILEFAIGEGEEQTRRSSHSLLLSAVAAGAVLAFTVLGIGVAATEFADVSRVAQRLAVAAVYPIGFVLCIMSGTQLFTEHTALAVYPVLDRRCGWLAMLRVWGIVLAGNLIGCGLGAALLTGCEPIVEASAGYSYVALHFAEAPPFAMLVSAVLAGWLMALGGWLILATPPAFSQIVMVYLVTFTIGFGGLHHAIAGAAELMTAMMTGAPLGWLEALRAGAIVSGGNLIGGSIFVALLNYGYIRQTQSGASRRRRARGVRD